MADDSLILEHLRAIRTTQEEHSRRFDRIEHRLLSLEQQVAGLRSDFVFQQSQRKTGSSQWPRMSRGDTKNWRAFACIYGLILFGRCVVSHAASTLLIHYVPSHQATCQRVALYDKP